MKERGDPAAAKVAKSEMAQIEDDDFFVGKDDMKVNLDNPDQKDDTAEGFFNLKVLSWKLLSLRHVK